jgi:hypothetical protein
MYVKLGKYKDGWFGPYQIANTLKFIGFSEDRCEKIGDRLEKTWVLSCCEWVYEHNPFAHRKVKIRIDPWDTWNMDDTLSQIIAPMLRQLQKEKHGSPSVNDEDVPEHLRSTVAPAGEGENEDGNFFARWDWVINEMIWAFEQLEGEGDWRDQYHSGVYDAEFKQTDRTHLSKETGNMEPTYELVTGPNHTHVFDREGYDKHYARMQNGYRLFGKYYTDLWD